MKEMTITIPQSDGYTRQEFWEQTNLYCPNCGKRTVWNCPDNMDYDSGESECLCTFCEYGGYGIRWSPLRKDAWYVVQRILDPTLSQPKHSPRPPTEMEKCIWRMMARNLKKDMKFMDWFLKPGNRKGKTIRFERMKPLSKGEGENNG